MLRYHMAVVTPDNRLKREIKRVTSATNSTAQFASSPGEVDAGRVDLVIFDARRSDPPSQFLGALSNEATISYVLPSESLEQKIGLLERRIAKLNKSLKNTESTLRKVAAAKGIDHGLASIFDDIQGLNFDDANFERKSELLKEIFEQNIALQGRKPLEPDAGASPAAAAAASPVVELRAGVA